jgi:hypothetical protein
MDRDSIEMAEDFDAPLPADLLAHFRGEEIPPKGTPQKKNKFRKRS